MYILLLTLPLPTLVKSCQELDIIMYAVSQWNNSSQVQQEIIRSSKDATHQSIDLPVTDKEAWQKLQLIKFSRERITLGLYHPSLLSNVAMSTQAQLSYHVLSLVGNESRYGA